MSVRNRIFKVQEERCINGKLKVRRPCRRSRRSVELGNILVLIPQLAERCAVCRVGVGIVSGDLVAVSPQRNRDGQADQGNSPRPEQ